MGIAEIQYRIGQIQSQLIIPAVAYQPKSASGTTIRTEPSTSSAFATVLNTQLSVQDTGRWVSPVDGRISSGFGPRWGKLHEGLDIAAAQGSPVRAATGGVVRSAAWDGGYGNAVVIDHGNGIVTRYAHNSAMTVHPGQRVEAGETIAKVGSTGNSTGPHVHFEVQVDNVKVDPQVWLRARHVSL